MCVFLDVVSYLHVFLHVVCYQVRHPKPSLKQVAAELQSSEGTLNQTIVQGEMTEGPRV